MKVIITITLLLLQITFIQSQTIHKVVVGSVGNKIAVNLRNTNAEKIEEIRASIISKPEWIEMVDEEIFITEIDRTQTEKLVIRFNISHSVAESEKGIIQIEVRDKIGRRWNKEIQILSSLPDHYELKQNYPNPFNPATKIKFSLAKESSVLLKVSNILGETVRVLKEELLKAGEYEVEFDGRELSSGIYFYSIEAGDFKSVKKMLLMK